MFMKNHSETGNAPLILVVDDSQLIRVKLRNVLESDGYSVAEAADGIIALELYGRLNPDMVLLDAIMPEMDGFAVCSRIKKHSPGDSTPVLMVTTLDDEKSVNLAFESGATDYITKPIHWAVLRHRVRRLLRARKAEEMVRVAHDQIKQLLASITNIFIGVDPEGRIIMWNAQAEKIFGIPASGVLSKPFKTCKILWDWDKIIGYVAELLEKGGPMRVEEIIYVRPDGKQGLLDITINPLPSDSVKLPGFVIIGSDITEKKKMDTQIVFSQKMESIGQLAAGIAHEINTPMQYIGDNMVFLRNAFTDFCNFNQHVIELVKAVESGTVTGEMLSAALGEKSRLDMEFLASEIPLAIEQSMKGIDRVSKLVLAMKDFSHPGTTGKIFSDINSGIEGTITISKNEWKYVADLKTDLDSHLPLVYCVINEINQVVLNMIVNAAQAIKDAIVPGSGDKGLITIKTERKGDFVAIAISDTGVGIPGPMMHRIFDPFFTTKDVGVGTGQGLAIAHNIIVNKHNGGINVESEVGKGTVFTICLPIKPKEVDG